MSLINKLVQYIIDCNDLSLFNAWVQGIINRIADDEDLREKLPILIGDALVRCYFPYNGYKFKICGSVDAVPSCALYDYSDIRETDSVLDIGACVGAFSIFASAKAKEVFAIEPLFGDIILENLFLNKISNIKIIECALGMERGLGMLNYDPRTKIVPFLTFAGILEQTGKCDFLKLDCEMGEWVVTADELAEFRRVEIEVHNFDGKHNLKDYEKRVEKAGFEYTTSLDPRTKTHSVLYIHGFKDT